MSTLEIFFDVSHHQIDAMVKAKEDLQFLADQRGDRIMKMAEVDRKFVEKKRAAERMEAEAKRKKREVERHTEAEEIVELMDAVDVEEEIVSDKEVA